MHIGLTRRTAQVDSEHSLPFMQNIPTSPNILKIYSPTGDSIRKSGKPNAKIQIHMNKRKFNMQHATYIRNDILRGNRHND